MRSCDWERLSVVSCFFVFCLLQDFTGRTHHHHGLRYGTASAWSFTPPPPSVIANTISLPFLKNNNKESIPTTSPPLKKEESATTTGKKLLVNRVAVVGATGRTGRYVIQELLDRGAEEVVALVRSQSKAQSVFQMKNQNGDSTPAPNGGGSGKNDDAMSSSSSSRMVDLTKYDNDRFQIVECDLTNTQSIEKALQGMEAAIWCATGFSSNQQDKNWLDKVKSLVGIATKQTIDLIGLPRVAETIQTNNNRNKNNKESQLPQIVMCSSAGVTRPTWDENKKQKLVGAADIPIVRLNPFGILDVKRESETILRQTKVPYCIVRPAGLNDQWPAKSRPILSQGDVAVGRINRRDVATLLVDLLSEPDATGKTFEVIALANYPPPAPATLTKSLQNLVADDNDVMGSSTNHGAELSLEQVSATYQTLQQLLPGETQDAAALAMGQTYEQLDQGETGRLGERGQEKFEGAAPRPN